MRFRQLPFALQAYISAQVVLLALLVGGLAEYTQPITNWWLTAALLFFTVVFSTWKVELTVFEGRMTLSFAVVCLALLQGEVSSAVMCAVLGAYVGSVASPAKTGWKVGMLRPPLYRIVFNLANCGLSCGVSVLLYQGVANLAPGADRSMATVLGVTAFTGMYFLLNTLGVSLAIALQQRVGWLYVWQQNFLWTAPGFFASASAAVGIHVAYSQMEAWALIFLPPIYVIYYSYRLYMDRLHLFADKVKQDLTHIEELNRLNQAVIASLATAIDAKDSHTCSHINRVQIYAVQLAKAAGLSGPDLQAISTGALVHDIGKLGIPDHILSKPGKLTPEEFRRIQSHVAIGAEILSPVPFPFPVVDVVLTHHERWDGLGYPRGMKGEDIPMGGRIISIVDMFDALTSNRPYRRAMTQEEALRIIQDGANKQFDPKLVDLFMKVLPEATCEVERMEEEQRSQAAESNKGGEPSSALIQIGQAAAEMAAVCDVAHSLAEQETIDGVVRVIVDRALSLLPADTAVLYLKTPGEPGLTAVAVDGKYREKLEGMTIEVGEGVAGWVAENQQPRVNVSATLDIARRFKPEETMELSAATAVPLVHGPDNLGVLAVYTMAYSVLSAHHLHVLNILAEHAASAIQNLRRVERNQELAFADPLTGLANSRCLVRHLERLMENSQNGLRRSDSQFSVVMLDLDHFKEVNDQLGHLRGDDLLRLVGEKLLEVARGEDVVCRYAGDEFVLLLPGVSRGQAERVAQRVRDAIGGLPAVDGVVKIGASVGVASYPEDGGDGRALIHVADQQMYEDKFERRRGPGGRGSGSAPPLLAGAGSGR